MRLKEFLISLFTAEFKSDIYLDLNIIVAGFAFGSVELNQIICDAIAARKAKRAVGKITLYVIDKKTKRLYQNNFKNDDSNHKFIALQKMFKDDDHFKYIPLSDNMSMGDAFEKIWERIEGNLNEELTLNEKKPFRGIHRHLLISRLFWESKKPRRFYTTRDVDTEIITDKQRIKRNREFIKYCYERLIVELILLTFQVKKILNIFAIRESRVGIYYSLYCSCKINMNEKPESLFDILSLLGYELYKGYVSDTYILRHEQLDNVLDEELLRKSKISKPLIDKLIQEKDTIERIARPSYNVRAKFSDKVSFFEEIKDENLLFSDIKWKYKISEFFEVKNQDKWDIILSSSETGNFFRDKQEFFRGVGKNKKILCVVLADYCIPNDNNEGGQPILHTSPDEFLFELNLLQENFIPMLPWWLHNQHFHLFIKVHPEGKNNYSFYGGVFYDARLLSKHVSPVLLTENNQSDLKKLFDKYIDYWQRGKMFMANSNTYELRLDDPIFNSDIAIPNMTAFNDAKEDFVKRMLAAHKRCAL
jgi:hypothetical protein